jgi:hypothetical protein
VRGGRSGLSPFEHIRRQWIANAVGLTSASSTASTPPRRRINESMQALIHHFHLFTEVRGSPFYSLPAGPMSLGALVADTRRHRVERRPDPRRGRPLTQFP